MHKTPLRTQIKAAFSAAALGAAGFAQSAYAQETVPAAAAPDAAPTPDPMSAAKPSDIPAPITLPTRAAQDRRGIDERTDDFFATRYRVAVTRDSIWVGTPQRFNVDLLNLPDNDILRPTRQYMEVRPLRKEWNGNASGVAVGMDFDLGSRSGYKIAGGTWHLRGGAYLGSFQSPYVKGEGRARNNDVLNGFVEGSRAVTIAGAPANLIVGASFNRAAGPEIDRARDVRLYQQANFPALFGSDTGDRTGIGRFSGAVQTYVGDRGAYGGKVGVYYNNMKSEGRGLNFSIGPEVHYDNDRGASFRLRVRATPRFLN